MINWGDLSHHAICDVIYHAMLLVTRKDLPKDVICQTALIMTRFITKRDIAQCGQSHDVIDDVKRFVTRFITRGDWSHDAVSQKKNGNCDTTC